MKQISLNIKKSGSRGNLLAVLLTVTASLLLSVSAWGDEVGFKETQGDADVWRVQFGYNNTNWQQHGNRDADYSGDKDLGVITTDLYLDNYYGYATGASDKLLKLYSRYKKNSESMPASFSEEYSQHWGDAGDVKIIANANKKLFTASSATPGNYTYEYYLQVYKQSATCNNCYCSNNGSNMKITFTYPGFSVSSKSQTDFACAPNATQSKTISFNHYGVALTSSNCSMSGSDFAVSSINESGVTVTFQPTSVGVKNVTLTITDENNKVCTVTLRGTAEISTEPTVFNAKKPVVSGFDATLSGYLKYTGCETIVANGFIVSDELSNMQGDTPTGTYTTNSVASMAAGDLFSRTDSYQNGTYYYRSYVKTDGDDEYYSPKTDIGSFVINGSCDLEATVTAVIDRESAVLSAGVAASLSTPTNAALYNWVCVTSPTSSTVTFSTQTKRNTDVTVDMAGDYTFKLQAKCSEEVSYRESSTVSLHVCAAPTVQQLYLDEEIANIICAGEKSTATIYSQEGYDYTLTSATKNYGTQVGSGATLTWRNVDGIGTYTVIASEHGTGLCQASMTAATQIESSAKLVVNASTLSAIAYQSVTLTVDDDASKIDHAPEWTITAGPSGYLVDVDTRLVYDAGKQRSSVDFKGGATTATTYTVSASTTYTTKLPHTSKVCDASTEVNIQVSPATEDCD